jgi:nucleoside-diphosphate kinase
MADRLPLIVMVLQGPNVVYKCRGMIGDTQPIFAAAGTIRGDFSSAAYGNFAIRNLIHASDSLESATKEIEIWFGDDDVLQSH